MTGKRRAPRISQADRPGWPLVTANVGAVCLLADVVGLTSVPSILFGLVLGVTASMLVLALTIGPRRDAYERHLSEAVCVHRRDTDPEHDPPSAA